MGKKNVIVIGASAGGLGAIKTILSGLPKPLDATILIVWHMAPDLSGAGIVRDLQKLDILPVALANDHELMENGTIYIAPPDHHLLIDKSFLRISRGPRENGFRPAIDPLFRSAAYALGPRVIGIILSGALDDGTSGLWSIANHGGTTIVQDPSEAEVRSMPDNAIAAVNPDYILKAGEIANVLVRLVSENANEFRHVPPKTDQDIEIRIAMQDRGVLNDILHFGQVTQYTCPECHGVLSSIVEGSRVRFRCHTGHAYSVDSLLANVTLRVEESVWSSIRGVEEIIILLNSVADQYAARNDSANAAKYLKKAKAAQTRREALRAVVLTHEQFSLDSFDETGDDPQEKNA